MPLEHPDRVAFHLRAACVRLSDAHRAAGEAENGQTDLNGPVRDVIFGLNTAVESLRLLIEEQG